MEGLSNVCKVETKENAGYIRVRVTVNLGRAIAQAISCRFPTAAARVQTRVWSCGIL
jgi:hypothetical protein